ncbi:hypothetical protein Goshw_001823 [Gossypium schwendimanii]|uniref:Uncharacterized protein n=1 Tax=Gossypium schwendimanii TaxID=34291 RepID=A0A7J9MZ00_GOSSC|nr:hypothetical protein [Gossypium schwendimanii]
MQLSKYGLRRHSRRNVIVLQRGTRQNFVSLLEKWTWCLPLRSIRPYFSAQRFKLTRLILYPLVSRPCEI